MDQERPIKERHMVTLKYAYDTYVAELTAYAQLLMYYKDDFENKEQKLKEFSKRLPEIINMFDKYIEGDKQ